MRRAGDTALQAFRLQARLNLHRAVGAVRPDPLAGIGKIEHIVQLLTVVHGRVRRVPFADQLVRLVHAEVVLVAEEARIVLLRPTRVLVLLGILGGLLLPSLRRLAGLDRLVLLRRVALLGHRHNRGVNNLAAARNIAYSNILQGTSKNSSRQVAANLKAGAERRYTVPKAIKLKLCELAITYVMALQRQTEHARPQIEASLQPKSSIRLRLERDGKRR